MLAVVVPDWNPWELLMAQQKIQISSVGGVSLSVVVQSVDLTIWEWNAPKGVSPTIFAVSILVDVV